MDKISDKINKLSLPVVILIASIILGGFFYVSQVSKQKSIEKQQEIKMADDRRIEEVKAEQAKKEYVVKRKKDCYELEISERKKYNNVDSSGYNEEKDVCEVSYINKKWKEGDPIFGKWNETLKMFTGEAKYFTNEF